MRSRWVYNKGEVVYAEERGVVTVDKREVSTDPRFYVIKDCEPFKSMVDGSIINSRSQYRAHLKEHGCIEVGNDSSVLKPVQKPLKAPPGLKAEILKVARQRGCI